MTTIQVIKSVVTHFSEQLKYTNPLDEVTVAGKIISVTEFSKDFLSDEENPNPESYVSLVLDDYIGETRVLISSIMYHHYKSIIEIGSFVQIDGLVNLVTAGKFNEYSVVGYDMNTLPV